MRRQGNQGSLGDSLGRLVKKLDRANGGAYLQLVAARAWDEVAGEATTSHTTGAHLKGRELVVFCDSPLWATELSSLSERYRVAINEAIGKELVDRVRFTVSRRVDMRREEALQEASNEAFYASAKVKAVPLSQQELEQVQASVEQIADAELRGAVLRATVADLEWKKGLAAQNARETPREQP